MEAKGNRAPKGPKEGGLNIGQRSNQVLLTTPLPWDPLSSLSTAGRRGTRLICAGADADPGRLYIIDALRPC